MGTFKWKNNFDLARVYIVRDRKKWPTHVPLCEFFDATTEGKKQPSVADKCKLGRVIIPLCWLWEVADIVATLVKPGIPRDLTMTGNDVLPAFDVGSGELDPMDAEKEVDTGSVVNLIQGLLRYIDEHGRQYFVERSDKEFPRAGKQYHRPHPRIEVTTAEVWRKTPNGVRPRVPRFLVEAAANLPKMPRDVFSARVVANYSPRIDPVNGSIDDTKLLSDFYAVCRASDEENTKKKSRHLQQLQVNSDIFKRHGHYNLQRLFRKHFTSDTNDALQSETEDEETDVESEKGEDKEKGCLGRIKELCKPKRPEGDLEGEGKDKTGEETGEKTEMVPVKKKPHVPVAIPGQSFFRSQRSAESGSEPEMHKNLEEEYDIATKE